jgi:hypothetical protein
MSDFVCWLLHFRRVASLWLGLAVLVGCGRPASPDAVSSTPPQAPTLETRLPSTPEPGVSLEPQSPERSKPRRSGSDEPVAPLPERRTLADLLEQDDDDTFPPPLVPGEPSPQARSRTIPIDAAKVAAAGIRKYAGQHLVLYTDVAADPEVAALPEIFDVAVVQWCDYFDIDPLHVADWQMIGFLMQERNRFEGAGLLPADLPPFLNGYQRGMYLWAYQQPDAYYRRHLLLHEGVHGFMHQFLGGIGPPWYAEGMAELLGTHRWQDGQLQVAYMPRDRDQTPGWGRIRIVQDELQAGRGMMPISIMNYGPQAHLQNEPYGWCWALAAFLDGHPDFRERFRSLHHRIRYADLTQACQELFASDWIDLNEQWQIFVVDLDYGYDLERAAVQRKPVAPLPPDGRAVSIAVDRGWQSTGIRLEAGATYRLTARGRYQVAQTDRVWWCEPGGVTIQYHQGRPLGLLVGAIRDESEPLTGLSPLTRPEPVGLGREWTPHASGTLYLKINESPARLADNQGELTVRIEPAAE